MSVEAGADAALQAASLQGYFPSCLWLPTQNIITFWPVLNYNAWCRVPTLSLANKTFQNFSRTPKRFSRTVVAQQCQITDKQQLLTLYIQCDSTSKRFITSCKGTVWL